MEIISKRHFYKYYLVLILSNLFLLTFSGFLATKGFEENNNKIILGSLFLFVIAISITFGFIKSAPKIILNKEGITFKKIFYPWRELTNSKLTGKGDMIFTSGECTTLFFNDKTRIQFFDDFYSNSAEMKYFIEGTIHGKVEKTESTELSKEAINIDSEFFIPYKGNPVFSFRGIMMWGLIVFICLIPLWSDKRMNKSGIVFFTIFSGFWFIMNSWMMDYFELSKNFFVIKNHYFFWKKVVYPIAELKEVVFEQQSKGPNTLRIILKDFSVKKYYAGSLKDTTWLELKTDLELKNITVRNECIPQ